ncbi:MAG TPA: hypothetical protein VMW08_10085 [Acidimicrobiales bacterium]|nr:hypothetical protein [Acidimicrobiales bacterium]
MRPRLTPDPTPPAERCGSRWWDAPGELRGINLRSWLVLELADAWCSVTVAELVDRADASGWRLGGRASKTISDALRWEVARGRAVRLDRGRYACGGIAKTTRHRMRRRLAACQARAARRAGCGKANHTVDDLLGVRGAAERFYSSAAVAETRNRTTIPDSGSAVTAGLAPRTAPDPTPP